MSVKISSSPQRLTIALGGELDHHSAAAMRQEADAAIEAKLSPKVRLDFSAVTFMDSAGVGFVLGRYRLVNSYGGRVEVTGLDQRLYRMMRMAGLERLVTLCKKEGKKK
ncbi:MAG: STAS domain-containing protein [Clostridia bacterium]|nr:STAS domain-containing protein [Clostridia bacterium]